jgi:hypothetical protein
MQRALLARGVSITEGSGTKLMQRDARTAGLAREGSGAPQGTLAIAGAACSWPSMECLRMWGMRCTGRVPDGLSEELLLARPLLRSRKARSDHLTHPSQGATGPAESPGQRGDLRWRRNHRQRGGLCLPQGTPPTLSVSRALWTPPSRSTKPIAMPRPNCAKHGRGGRPMERALEERSDPEAEASRGYCLAVRSSLPDDGRAPLEASGLKLEARLTQSSACLARVEQKKVFRQP